MKKLINFCSGIVFPLLLLFFIPLTDLIAATNQNQAGGHSTHWGYTGSSGPSEWYRLAKAYALCGSGKRQSPVDIWNETPAELYPLDFQYQSIPLQVLNNGHTLQANYHDPVGQQTVTIDGKPYPVKGKPTYNSTLMLGDVAYKLLQFHFHTPSEHARNGGRYAMEVHLVHKSADGNLAVVGVLLKQGKMNPTLGKILDHASDKINQTKLVKGVTINATDLLPADHSVFHYSGSLTTPPCSENVNWFVMKSPVEVSDSQVKQFARIVGENARPIQSMYWRSMLTSE